MKKAYSYIRYSSKQQAKGDSFRRQLATTQAYCDKNGYKLDTELSLYKELGISGFQGDQENLKQFIVDCETGKVKKGSLLIVENLDRLSRQSINIAMRQFLHLLDYVDIYTTQDNKHYSQNDKENNDSQLIDIMTSLIIMSRAYEESATKQKRSKESWDNQRKNIHLKKMGGSQPHWLELSQDKTIFLIKEDRVRILKHIFNLCIQGMGHSQIVRHLNANISKYPSPSNRSELWIRATVAKLLSDRRLVGEHQLYTREKSLRKHIGDPIIDYFPKVIEENTFLEAQISMQSRKIGKGKTTTYTFSNLFRSILRCGTCGDKMEYINKGERKKENNRYLTCGKARRGGDCNQSKHFKYLPLEHMLIHLTAENGFMPKPQKPHELNYDLENLKEKNKVINSKLNVLLEQDFTIPAIMSKVNELTSQSKTNNANIQSIEEKLLTFEPDYTYEELFNDIIEEEDNTRKYANRSLFNSYLSKNIEQAYLFGEYAPIIIFKMKNEILHSVILDGKYNFGGCSLPNGKDTFKRLNGDASIIDSTIWKIQQDFLELINNSKGISFTKKQKEDFTLILKSIDKLISKLILSKNINVCDKILENIALAINLIKNR